MDSHWHCVFFYSHVFISFVSFTRGPAGSAGSIKLLKWACLLACRIQDLCKHCLLLDLTPYLVAFYSYHRQTVNNSFDVKKYNIVDTFRLQEQPAYDKKQLVTFMKRCIKLLAPKLEAEKQELFKKHIEGATKFLFTNLKDFQYFVGESMHDDGSLVFAYYKEGATDPTFLYLAYGLMEIKC